MKENPVRIQRSRKYKQVSPNGLPIVYVGRPTWWGNPFKINIDGDATECVKKYEQHIKGLLTTDARVKLKGKNLSCWCKVGEPCHADILLKIANQ